VPDINIKISVDPATGAVAVTSDTGGGPAPGDIFPGAPNAADAGAAPGPASGIMAEQESAADFGDDAPAPLDPSQLGAAVGGEHAAIGVAPPPPEDLEVLAGEAADAAEQSAPEPMPLTDLEAEADKKPRAKAKPKQTKKKS
jgi:hypothetical protein